MNEELRIGVFVCDCGSNIAGVVDVPDVVTYAKGLDHVVLADEGRWSCSVDYLSKMQDLIKEHQINRIVVASCTPRTHEPLFKHTVKEAGVNPYLLEFVSIREQVSWVHMKEPEIATEKAKDLVKMGVAKAALLEEGQEIRLPVKTVSLKSEAMDSKPACAVINGSSKSNSLPAVSPAINSAMDWFLISRAFCFKATI